MGGFYTKEDILNKLRGYGELERRKAQLVFELENYIEKITPDELIESLTFKGGLRESVSGGQPADITADLAESYRVKTDKMNLQDRLEMELELKMVEFEINRLTYYPNLLCGEQADAIKLHYFENNTVAQTAKEMNITIAAVKRVVRAAVTSLTEMYNYIANC